MLLTTVRWNEKTVRWFREEKFVVDASIILSSKGEDKLRKN